MAEPALGEALTPRKDYLKLAYETLEGEMKKDLQDLRDRFDKDTKKAIATLTAKKQDRATKDVLKAIGQQDYHKLTIGEKGDLQRWALAPGKGLNSETIEGLSIISIVNQSREDTQSRASGDTASVSLDELLMVCGERKDIAEQKKKVFKFLNKEVDLNSLWSKLVDTVDKLKSVGDTATSSNQTAGLVWGIFKVLLQFAVLSEKGAEAAFSGMQTAANVIQRAATYEKHIYDPTRRQILSKGEIQPFETCLVSTYQRVFRFFVTANKCFKKNKASLSWYVFWSAGDILKFEHDVLKYEQSLFRDATIKSLVDQSTKADLIHDLLKDASARILGTQHSTQGVLARQSGIELLLNTLKSKVDGVQDLIRTCCPDVTRDQMLGWFSGVKVKDHHRAAKGKRTPHTARWILKRPEYKAWSREPISSLLWIKGISGAGKTTVISRLVDTYNESAKKGDDFAKPHVAYFYCKRDAADRRFAENIFRSFIRQLASAYHPLPEGLTQTYREKSPQSSLSNKLYKEDYETLLLDLIPRTTETVLILDALDECIGDDTQSKGSSPEIGEVLKTLRKLLDEGLPIKIVVASRYDSRIEDNLQGTHVIEISADDNSNDIEKMVVARINEYNKEARPVTIKTDLREKILDVFHLKSQGKFQWATLHIDYLLDGLRERRIPGAFAAEETLGELPEGLVGTYSEIIHHISTKLNKRQRDAAFRVFKWLLVMGTCDEKVLIAATCQRLQGQPGDLPDRVEGDAGFILTACQHLVTIQDSKFRFSHLSVQEYFEACRNDPADTSHAHRNVAQDIAHTCHYDVAKVCATVFFLYKMPDQAIHRWLHYCNMVNIYLPFMEERSYTPGDDPIDKLWYFCCRNWYSNFQKLADGAQREDVRCIINASLSSSFITWLNVRVTEFMVNSSIEPRLHVSTGDDANGPFAFRMELGPNLRMHRTRMDRPEDSSLFSRFPIGPEALVEGFWTINYGREALSVPCFIEIAISCGILNKLQRHITRNMTNRGHIYINFQEDQERLNMLFQSILEDQVKDRKQLSHGSLWSFESIVEALELGYETREQEDFLTLCSMFVKWRQAATSLDMNELVRYEHLFSAAAKGDGECRQCYGELARLMLLLLSLEKTRSSLSQQLGDFLFDLFPDATAIEYRYLKPLIVFDLDSALIRGAKEMDQRYLGILLSHGANIHTVTFDETPLVAAVSSEKIDNAEFLLQKGARMDEVKYATLSPKTGYANATIMACSIQEQSLFDFLYRHSGIDKDVEVDDAECRTPLIAACRYGHVDRVALLLSMGVDLTRRFTSGSYRNALCAAVGGRSIRVFRQLLELNPLQLRELKNDALEKWRDMYHATPEPDYQHSIDQKCRHLQSWLTLAFLHSLEDPPEEEYNEGSGDEGDDGDAGDINSEEGPEISEQESIGSYQSEDSDYDSDSDQDTTSSSHIGDDGMHASECGSDEDDGNEESEINLDQEEDQYETDRDTDGEKDSSPESVVMEQNDVRRGTTPKPDDALRNINNLVSWLKKYCAEDPQSVRRQLALAFGFPLLDENDDGTVELVHNALLKGFQNALHLTLPECTVHDVTETWADFLTLAESSLALPRFYENALGNGDEAGLRTFHRRLRRLENGF